jgi:LAO/AO transport system kinase
VTYSALTGEGVPELWQQVLAHRQQLSAAGEFAARRREQQVKWMWAMLEDRFHLALNTDAKLKARLPAIEKAVAEGTLAPALAVEEIAQALGV